MTDSVPTTSSRRWWILLAVGFGTFMSALDGSIVNTVLPVIRESFGAEVATIQWVITIYLLVVSGLLLSFGRLGDLRGHKRVYLYGFSLFVCASVLCSIAPSAPFLIALRGVQALGAAMLMSNSPAILTRSFPPSERGKALGLLATMTYLGLTIGPSLGGWLASTLSWRAVFAINLPTGLLAFSLSVRHIPHDDEEKSQTSFDRRGALVFLCSMVLLLSSLNKGHDWGWFSPGVLVLFGGAALLLSIFILLEGRTEHPMVDLSLFRERTFTAATTTAILHYACLFTASFLLPFYLIQGRDLSPGRAGLILTAQPLTMAIIAPISGALSDRIGTRIPAVLGMSVLACGLFTLSHLGPESRLHSVVVALTLVGLGTGIFISPNTSALMGSAPRHRQGIAAGILATARNVGMVLGVGLAGAIFTTILSKGDSVAADGLLFEAIAKSIRIAAGIAAIGAISAWFVRGRPAQKTKNRPSMR